MLLHCEVCLVRIFYSEIAACVVSYFTSLCVAYISNPFRKTKNNFKTNNWKINSKINCDIFYSTKTFIGIVIKLSLPPLHTPLYLVFKIRYLLKDICFYVVIVQHFSLLVHLSYLFFTLLLFINKWSVLSHFCKDKLLSYMLQKVFIRKSKKHFMFYV